MKFIPINPNKIRFDGLDFFENPIFDEDLYIEMDDELNVTVQFKGTKCIFSSRVPTCAELDICPQFYITSHNEWNPYPVNIRDLRKISQLSKNNTKYIYKPKRDTVYTYPIPTSNHVHDTDSFHKPSSDEAILPEISSVFIKLKELCIAQINATMTSSTSNGIQSEIMPLRS